MMKRIVLAVALVASTLTVGGVSTSTAKAQDVQITGPRAGAPAGPRGRIYREGRFQVQPFAAFTLQDEFSRTLLAGAQLQFHLTDWLGIGAWGGYGVLSLDTGLTDEVEALGQTTERNELSLPSRANFSEQIGRIQWVAAAQLIFIPLRGKLSLFQKLFVDTDFYIAAGPAFVGVEERADVDNAGAVGCLDGPMGGGDPCIQTQLDRASRVAITGTAAVGLMLYFNDFIGLSIEYRALPFAWNTSGTDEAGPDGEFPDDRIDSDDQLFHYNHMVSLGVAFYLPTEAKVSE